MILNTIWFALFVVVISGYLILDGFDMGVGILHLIAAKNDGERRIALNSIGPVWDGNEVWLVLGGGALFAAFPLAYASLFSGFYTAMMLVLLVMILRTVAIEFRSKRESMRWRSSWDGVFSLASAGLALLLGVAFGNIVSGVPLDASGNVHVTLLQLLKPFALLVGVTTVAMLAMHGAIYLTMKTEGEQQARIRRTVPRLMLVLLVLLTLVVLAAVLSGQPVTSRYLAQVWPLIFPAAALIALIVSWYSLRNGRYFGAFLASSAMIALLLITGAVGLFPNLLISTTDPQFNLTIYNASSAPNTLTAMLIIAAIGLPLVLLYTATVYYIFRGKTVLDSRSY
jgi:cytochrome d ubiquinol oxidase subunit II